MKGYYYMKATLIALQWAVVIAITAMWAVAAANFVGYP